MNSNEKGALTESKALEYFTNQGYTVFLPFADTCSVDMIVMKDEKYLRIQCKTAALSKDEQTIVFSAKSCNRQKIKDYHGKIDYFFVYCDDIKKKYLFPIDKAGKASVRLRLNKPLRQRKSINFASDYEII